MLWTVGNSKFFRKKSKAYIFNMLSCATAMSCSRSGGDGYRWNNLRLHPCQHTRTERGPAGHCLAGSRYTGEEHLHG